MATVEGVEFLTTYFTPAQVEQAFGRQFQRVRLEGLSVFTPAADNKTFARRFPRLYAGLVKLDDWLSTQFPFTGWGDFFIISLRYAP